ncbi:MAG: hypothetical protein KIT68_13720 [Phycisphaeraceae bacterium]|nr:hypothetical protein [Phycisphaeraceae bacterium]
MQFMNVDEIAKHALADHERGEEISPGVVVERRTILRFGVAAAGLAAASGLGLAGCAAGATGSGSLANTRGRKPARAASADEFVAAVMPQARALIAAPAPDEEAYLAAVTALLSRVEPPPAWQMFPAGKGWEMDTIAYYPPIVLMQIKMAPKSVIHLHDHRHYNGVLLATQGAARCRNFDIVQPDGKRLDIAAGEVPSKGEDFLIRQNADTVLRPRQLSTLTRDRDNIHHVEAGDEGATLVDFFTHFSPKARSYELAWDGKAYDEAKGLYKVAWKDA